MGDKYILNNNVKGKNTFCCSKSSIEDKFKGDIGDKGPLGDKGPPGPQGEKGAKGYIGPKGALGDIGPVGEKGPIGPQGDRGDKGITGPPGETGPIGPPGDKGDAGPIGEIGETGPSGPIGEKGEIGGKGPKGERGNKGPQGDRGDTGPPGDKGPVGDIGDRGIKGPPGDDGPPGPAGGRGDIGYFGYKGIKIDSQSEIGIKKLLQYLFNRSIACSIDVATKGLNIIRPLTGINSRTPIDKIQLSCVYFEDGIVVPINSIETISFAFGTVDAKTRAVEEIVNIFNEAESCTKQSPENLPISPLGEPSLTGDLRIDYEYTLVCNSQDSRDPDAVTIENGGVNIGNCVCRADKVPLCDLAINNSSSVARGINSSEMNPSKQITSIITKRGNFTDLSGLGSSINLIGTFWGNIMVEYIINTAVPNYVVSLINIDKLCYIDFA